jgi:hypothetical protein
MTGKLNVSKLAANYLAFVQLAPIKLCCALMSPRPSAGFRSI